MPRSKYAMEISTVVRNRLSVAPYVDWVWNTRQKGEPWENVNRLALFLLKRRLHLEGQSYEHARVHLSLGADATPDSVMKELLRMDAALGNGDFAEVTFNENGELP